MDKSKNVLIYVVEDNLIYNRVICEYLKKQNFTNVKSYNSGKDCIKAVMSKEYPDVVIQDYYLGDSNGIDVLLAVKKLSKNTEFVFLTANEDIEVAINSIKYGAYDYIIKDNDVALKKVVYKINKISKLIELKQNNKTTRLAMIILLLVLLGIIISGMLLYAFDVIQKA